MSPEKLVVVGQGYVGLPIAMRAVEVGYDVVGLDTDATRVDGLVRHVRTSRTSTPRAGGSAEHRADTHRPPRLEDAAGFDFAIITVPTRCARPFRTSASSRTRRATRQST